MVNLLRAAAACLLLAVEVAAGVAGGAEIQVRTDRTDIASNESFQLVFSSRGELDDGPDFEPLEKDFEILSQTQSQNLRIIGLQRNMEQEWTLSLMPRRAGQLRIPPIEFGADRSPEIQLNVRPARDAASAGDRDVFLETELDADQTWVGAQVVLTVRIFHAPEIRGGRLQPPSLSPSDAVVEILGDDRSYHTQRGGRRYFVVERRYVLFAHSPGPHEVRPFGFQAQVLEPATRLDPFRRRTRTVTLRSEPMSLEVRPIPPEFVGQPWLPARGLSLAEHWSQQPPELTQGEPVTRTLALIADGLLATQLPELGGEVPEGLRQYPDQPRLETQKKDAGVLGLREEKHAIIANRAGSFELPGLALRWFNTTTGRAEVARLPPRTLTVAGVATPPPAAAPAAVERLLAPTPATPNPWPAVAAALGLGWLITALAWWRQTRRRVQAAALNAATGTAEAALRRLQRAARDGAAAEAEKAVLDWARAIWPTAPPASLGAVARRVDEPAADALRRLEGARYAAGGTAGWSDPGLATSLRRARTGPAPAARSGLPPLHPNLG